MPKKPREYTSGRRYGSLIEALIAEPKTRRELMEITGLCEDTIHRFVRSLRRRGLVYIEEWDLNARGSPCIPCYRFTITPLVDAKRPRAMTLKERYRRDVERRRMRKVNSVFTIGDRKL